MNKKRGGGRCSVGERGGGGGGKYVEKKEERNRGWDLDIIGRVGVGWEYMSSSPKILFP